MQDCLAVAPQMIISLVYSEWDSCRRKVRQVKVLQRGRGRKFSEERAAQGRKRFERQKGSREEKRRDGSKKERSKKLGCLNIGTLKLMLIFKLICIN